MTVAEQIAHVIKGALPHVSDDDVKLIVDHLMSDAVGLTSITDLMDVTTDMLPEHPKLPKLKANQLLKAFANATSSAEHLPPSTSTQNAERPLPFQSVQNTMSDRSYFDFTVPWQELPSKTKESLEASKQKKEKASPKSIDELKLAIAKKLKSRYLAHKEDYPGCQKYPGRRIYRNIATQVVNKYGDCIKTIVNNRIIGDGTQIFAKALEICVENLMRDTENLKKKSKTGKGNKLVGVLLEQYNPALSVTSREEQEGIKSNLQTISTTDPKTWNWIEIMENMKDTYSLQRDDIVMANDKVMKQVQQNEEDMDKDDDDLGEESALQKLKEDWPFLFVPKGVEQHYRKLSGKDLNTELNNFIEKHMEFTTYFLITSSKTNLQNLALRMKLERKYDDVSDDMKFLMMLQMMSNHFQENESFASLVVPAEKTVSPLLFPYNELEKIKSLCIVALDLDIYAADKFFVCADGQALVETATFKEAFIVLVKIAFILDLEYPSLPFLFEFMERYVLGLGLIDTKVLKQGKQIVVISDTVKKFIDGIENFEIELVKECNK